MLGAPNCLLFVADSCLDIKNRFGLSSGWSWICQQVYIIYMWQGKSFSTCDENKLRRGPAIKTWETAHSLAGHFMQAQGGEFVKTKARVLSKFCFIRTAWMDRRDKRCVPAMSCSRDITRAATFFHLPGNSGALLSCSYLTDYTVYTASL